jgi:hypothetical protein
MTVPLPFPWVLILRERDPGDRRTNRLSITDKGRHLMERAYTAVERIGSPLTEVLTPDEADLITPALEKLARKAKEISEQARKQAYGKGMKRRNQ